MNRTDWFLKEIDRMREQNVDVIARGLRDVGPEDRWDEVGAAWTKKISLLYPQGAAESVERTFGVVAALQRQKHEAESQAARLSSLPPVPAMTLADEGDNPIRRGRSSSWNVISGSEPPLSG